MLGMLSTNFRNASGLPNRYNYTTARDMAKLALALYRNFPNDYGYFSTEDFSYDGRTYYNHNHLMAHYPGMDGLKTGFIDASGFNLAASAVRDRRRLIGVIMGGRTAHSRDLEMAALLNAAFAHRALPTRMIAAAQPAPPRDALYRRAIADLAPVAHPVAVPVRHVAPPVLARRAPLHRRHDIAFRHERHRHERLARDRHGRRHFRLASRRHQRLEELARRARAHREHERLAALERSRHWHHRHFAEIHHRHVTHRYAELHRRHRRALRHYARATRHLHHRIAIAAAHRPLVSHSRTYAELHRRHPARRVYRTANWACSVWAVQHHRCPGGHLRLPRGMMKAAAIGATGSSS
jgi:D-alanyl-D-alanine carboxypeptidase